MNILELLQTVKAIIHTFIRFLPLGFYSFAYLLAALFKDKRGAILLLGLVLNDVAGYSYKNYFNSVPNENCSIFGKKTDGTSLGFLPNSHTEIVAFVTAYIYSNMWDEYKFDLIPFVFLALLLLLTIYSRISIGCKNMKDVIFNLITGALLGMLFYYFTGKRYSEAKKGLFEKETCDLGYNNYRCNEIRDGTVILKGSEKRKGKGKDPKEDEKEDKSYDNYYDNE